MKQKYVMLFSIIDRDLLQDNLNKGMKQYEVHDIDVWNQGDIWHAKVIYSFKDQDDK